MAEAVSYARQTLESPNPITRFAHRARYRISLALSNKLLSPDGRIVDFGAGEGTFLARLHDTRPDASLVAIEPYMEIDYPFIERLAAIETLAPASVDLVTAFETLEHISDEDLEAFLAGARRAVTTEGRLLVTVPIMYGATLPVKEISRSLLHRRWSDTSAGELVRATFGRPIPRTDQRRWSHKGFDFRQLKKEIERHFAILRISYSPFPWLPWWLNSQTIFIAEKRP